MAKKTKVVNEWMTAPQWVVDIGKRMIEAYHTHLKSARIGFIMRTETPQNGGKATFGGVERVSAKTQVNLKYDFIIWIAKKRFDTFRAQQREALIDHLLCHCKWDAYGMKAGIKPHDIEEFLPVLQRHGYWWPDAYAVHEVASQAPLFDPESQGKIEAVDVTPAIGDAVADFLAGMDAASPDGWEASLNEHKVERTAEEIAAPA